MGETGIIFVWREVVTQILFFFCFKICFSANVFEQLYETIWLKETIFFSSRMLRLLISLPYLRKALAYVFCLYCLLNVILHLAPSSAFQNVRWWLFIYLKDTTARMARAIAGVGIHIIYNLDNRKELHSRTNCGRMNCINKSFYFVC